MVDHYIIFSKIEGYQKPIVTRMRWQNFMGKLMLYSSFCKNLILFIEHIETGVATWADPDTHKPRR